MTDESGNAEARRPEGPASQLPGTTLVRVAAVVVLTFFGSGLSIKASIEASKLGLGQEGLNFFGFLALASVGAGAAVTALAYARSRWLQGRPSMLLVAVTVGIAAFAISVWPTLYAHHKICTRTDGRDVCQTIVRINRLTGRATEVWPDRH